MSIDKIKYQSISAFAKQHNVLLIAVSKLQTNEKILDLYDLGHLHFAENYVQELCSKAPLLPINIKWHFIGHLQSNKVKNILPFIDTIHSIDNLNLLQEVQKRAALINKKINILFQIKIAQESTKFGLSENELNDLLQQIEKENFSNIEIVGLMGMASFVNDEYILNAEFSELQNIFNRIKKTFFSQRNNFKELSMGMSSDYELAIANGSTMIRVGSSIFGERK